MSLVLTSPEDIINNSLARIGYKLRIGSIYEGSMAAKKALDIYGQTRDELLRQDDWGFAERNAVLTLIKTAPALPGGGYGYIPPVVWNPATNPPLPYLFSYTYPGDCLKVRALKTTPLVLPVIDPRPVIYKVSNDNSVTPAVKILSCNLPNAELVYTGQVTDPTTWEADFTELLCAALARLLAPGINPEILKIAVPDEAQAMTTAEANQG
jgi:hypothetical protein